jgi:predicted PurR-regulated permease PerM
VEDEDRFYLRAFSVGFALLLVYLLWLIFRPFLSAILWAVLLAFMLFPVNALLRRRFRGRNGAAALLMTFAVLLGVVVPAVLLGGVFVNQASDLLRRVTGLAARYQIETPQDLFRIPAVGSALRWIEAKTPISAAEVQRYAINAARSGLELALSSTKTVVLGLLAMLGSLFLMLFILYFFFRDGEEIAKEFIDVMPTDPDRKAELIRHLSQVTKAVVYGSLVTALVQGALVGLAFAVCGLPSPVVFGVLAGVASLLPVGGTAFVWGPGAVVLAVQGRWGWAIALAVWGALIVGSADNVLRPALISGQAKISTLPVFFGVLGGIAAFGPIGMFLGPVVLALALALMRYARDGAEGRDPAASERRGKKKTSGSASRG